MQITREELYEAVWRMPAVHLEEVYGITNEAIGKHCRYRNIPRPGKGYWVQVELGTAPPRPPLPPVERSYAFQIGSRSKPKLAPFLGSLSETVAALRTGDHPAIQAGILDTLHPALRPLQTVLEKHEEDCTGRLNGNDCIGCTRGVVVAPAHVDRAMRFLSRLCRVTEKLGCQTEVKQRSGGLHVDVVIGVRRIGIQFIDEVKKTRVRSWQPEITCTLTGVRVFKLLVDLTQGEVRKSWRERGDTALDESLGEIAAEILMAAEFLRRRDEAAQEKQRLEKLERLRRQEEEDARRLEVHRRGALEQAASNWEKSRRVAAFVSACRTDLAGSGKLESSSAATRWLAWAEGYITELDPLQSDFVSKQAETFEASRRDARRAPSRKH